MATLTIKGYAPLQLPLEHMAPLQGKFKGDTSYAHKFAQRWQRPAFLKKQLSGKLLCLAAVRSRIAALGGYSSYTDAFAGLGISARILSCAGQLALNDMAEDCRQCLRLNFPGATISGYDAMEEEPTPAECLFMDFNDFTARRGFAGPHRQVLERLGSRGFWRWIIVTDCTPFYFRYGRSSFETYSKFLNARVATVEDYFRAVAPAFQELGLQLIHAAYWTSPLPETAFLLLAPTTSKLPLKVEHVAPDPDLLKLVP